MTPYELREWSAAIAFAAFFLVLTVAMLALVFGASLGCWWAWRVYITWEERNGY